MISSPGLRKAEKLPYINPPAPKPIRIFLNGCNSLSNSIDYVSARIFNNFG